MTPLIYTLKPCLYKSITYIGIKTINDSAHLHELDALII